MGTASDVAEGLGVVLALALSPGVFGSVAEAAPPKPGALVVPTVYPSIQAAIDAASSGATIQVLAGW